MGSGGTQWETSDNISSTRMNQKTLYVGTSAPATTYAGMLYFKSDSNLLYERNGGDTAWLQVYPGMPSGSILLWAGTIATIPTGWYLCDGTTGTPDLRDKFVVAASSDSGSAPGTTLAGGVTYSGGAVTHHHADHSLTQPAISNHTLTQPAIHAHTLTQPVVGDHTYTTLAARTSTASTIRAITAVTAHSLTTNVAIDAHSLDTNVAIDAHAFTTNVAVSTHDTLSAPQPYYALAYIMRAY